MRGCQASEPGCGVLSGGRITDSTGGVSIWYVFELCVDWTRAESGIGVVSQMSKEQGGRTLGTALPVLEALEFIGQHSKGVSAKKLAGALGLSTSSAYSLLNSLRAENFVLLSPAESGLYVLGPEIVRLYKSYVESALQPERLVPYLEELRDRASCRAYVGVWNKGDLEVAEILGRRGARELKDVSKGFRGAAHALALGKIYLARIPEDEWPGYLHAPLLRRYTAQTTSSQATLHYNLLGVRRRGIAFDIEEYAEGACCIAAPVLKTDGRLVATIGISVSSRRFKHQHASLTRDVLQIASESTTELTRNLGENDDSANRVTFSAASAAPYQG